MRYIIEQASWQEACNGIACAFCTLKDRKNGECKIRNYIHNQPIYEERPHGEWKPDGTCSECGVYSSLNKNTAYFCPNCGSPMTEEAIRILNGEKKVGEDE